MLFSGGWEETENDDDITWLGNIFDDLKYNSEDLEEFVIKDRHGDDIEVSLEQDHICIRVHESCRMSDAQLTLDQFKQFHQKSGRLIATAQKNAKT